MAKFIFPFLESSHFRVDICLNQLKEKTFVLIWSYHSLHNFFYWSVFFLFVCLIFLWIWCHFLLAGIISFRILVKLGLLPIESLSFIYVGMFSSPFFERQLWWIILSLSALWIYYDDCLMASVVSDEKLVVKFFKVPLYVLSHFSIATFKFFSYLCLSTFWLWYIWVWILLYLFFFSFPEFLRCVN